MKRIFFFAVSALFAGLGAQSCMDNKIEPDPMSPGIDLYLKARSQHNRAMDGANIAFRLNILLAEAADQYVVGTPIELDELTVGGANLFSKLFITGTTITPAAYDGTIATEYTIKYEFKGSSASVDYPRQGSVKVTTGSGLIEDGSWTVASDADDPLQVFMAYDDYTGNPIFATIDFGDYDITPQSTGQWEVYIDGYGSSLSEPATSDWSGNWTIDTSFDAWDYASVSAADATVSVWGSAKGKTMFWADNTTQLNLKYEVSSTNPLLYAPGSSCDWYAFRSGRETVTIQNYSSVDPAIYPGDVAVVTTVHVGSCSVSQTLTYNRLTKTY